MSPDKREGPYIATASGPFYFNDPRPEDIDIHAIAHALSNLCRFGGHTSRFYSVAQHSVLMSRHLPLAGDLALQALLHDAPEAYLVDIPRPIKDMLPDYKIIEDKIWRVIARRFQLPEELSPSIKRADDRMLVTEASQLLDENVNGAWWAEAPWPDPYKLNLPRWSPDDACEHFLRDFRALMRFRNGETD